MDREKLVILVAAVLLLAGHAVAKDFVIQDSSGNDLFVVNETGEKNVLNGDLYLNGNALRNPASIDSFFASACSGDQVIQGINADGSYSCVDPASGISTEPLNTTLEAGNVANQTINMAGNNILSVGGLSTSGTFTSSDNYIQGGTASFSNLRDGSGAEIDVQSNFEMNGNSIQSNDGSEFSISNLDAVNDGFSVGGNVNMQGNSLTNIGSATLGWTNLTNYPSGCPAGEAVRIVDDTLTCIDVQSGGDVNASGAEANQVAYFQDNTTVTGDSNLYYDSANGELGIGTNNPSSALDVAGSAALNGDLTMTSGQILVESGTAGAPAYSFNGGSAKGMYSPNGNDLAFSVGGAQVFYMGSNIQVQNRNIQFNNNSVSGVPSPGDPFDAVNKRYVDTSDNTVSDDQGLQDVLSRGNAGGGQSIRDVSALNITDVANFTSSGVSIYQPLSVKSAGPLSVSSGIEMTDTSTNTIESYSTMYLQTSSASPTDIVLQPTGQVGIDSDLETTGNVTVGGNLDLSGGNITGLSKLNVARIEDGTGDDLVEVGNRIDMNSNTITGLPTPSAGSDAATKNYVDSSDANSDELVAIDSLASPGYIGAGSGSGVLRTAAPLTYTDNGGNVQIGVQVAKDIVAGSGLTGGANNVLTGTDSDVSLSLDSAVAGNQLTYSSGTLAVSEGSGSGLDADTLDGVQLANINWGDVAMAQSDISLADVGAADTNLQMNGYWVSNDGDNEGMYVDTTGNVGVGTNNPQELMDVNGDLRVRGDLDVWGNITNTNVNNLNVNGSILPPQGYDATFDVGSSTRRWRDAYFSGSGTFGSGLTVSSGTVSLPSGEIQNSELQNSQITINGGTGIQNAGSVSLGSSISVAHADTSSQADVSNSGGTVVQGIDVDGQGHTTTIRTTDLDNRYYTESTANNTFVEQTGDSMSGNLDVNARIYSDNHGFGGTPQIAVAVGDTDTGLHSDTDGRLEFWTNNNERFSLSGELKSQGANLDMSGNNIQNFFAGQCPSGEVVAQVNSDGSYTCISITGAANDTYVNENGDSMTGALTMNGNDIRKAGVVNATDLQIMGESTDALYVDDSGDAMSGNLNMQNNDVTNVDQVLVQDAGSSPGQAMVEVGDDAYLTDVDSANTVAVQGQTDSTQATIELGSGGAKVSGTSSGETCIGDQCT